MAKKKKEVDIYFTVKISDKPFGTKISLGSKERNEEYVRKIGAEIIDAVVQTLKDENIIKETK